jgi:hypothetical protein
MSEPTSEGQRVIEAWQKAIEDVDMKQRMKYAADRALEDCRKAVVKWMLPEDAKTGEKICVWMGDALIEVHVHEPRERSVVTIRKRGRQQLRAAS